MKNMISFSILMSSEDSMPNRFGNIGLLSADNRKIVQFEENGMVYKGINNGLKHALRYDVDGAMISGGTKRCDKAIFLPDSETVYLIELKGTDLKKAAEQISQTMLTLHSNLDGCVVHGRVICTRIPTPDIRSTQVMRLELALAKKNGTFRKGCRLLSEDI